MASPLQTVAAAGYEPSMIRVLTGREDSVRPVRARELNVAWTRRLTSGYHLSAASRQKRVFKQLLDISYTYIT